MERMTLILEPADEGGFVARIPEVPGAISEGETEEEARANVLDAMRELAAYRRDEALARVTDKARVSEIVDSA
jgi:predicted RNase H-like HicB family nuclease